MNYVVLEKARKSFLVWDTGLAVDHARRLADDGNKVYYFTEWAESTPKYYRYAVGIGYPGVEKVKDFFKYIDKVDCIVFYYTGHGDLAEWLRGGGYTVFGAGAGEKLEYDRAFAKKVQKEAGLPVQNYKIIEGIDNVISYVKKNPKKYIKLNIFRGDLETFYAEDGDAAETVLNALKPKLGPFSDSFEFLVEDKVPDVVVETGWDLFFNGKDFVKPYLWGFLKDGFYIGKFSDELPSILKTVAEAIKPTLLEFNYRGAISVEVLVTKDKTPYVLDWTVRMFYPSGILYTYAIKNYSDVIFKVANGETAKIIPKGKFVGAKDIVSNYAMQNWVKVTYPKKLKDRIRIQGAMHTGDEYAVPSGYEPMAQVVTANDSVLSVIKSTNKLADSVGAFGYEGTSVDSRTINEMLEDAKSVGLDF